MLKNKQAGAAVSTEQPAVRGNRNVVDLMDALKRSLAGAPKPTEKIKTKKPTKRSVGQGEMLLPISGSKGSKEAVQKKPVPAAKPHATAAARKTG